MLETVLVLSLEQAIALDHELTASLDVDASDLEDPDNRRHLELLSVIRDGLGYTDFLGSRGVERRKEPPTDAESLRIRVREAGEALDRLKTAQSVVLAGPMTPE